MGGDGELTGVDFKVEPHRWRAGGIHANVAGGADNHWRITLGRNGELTGVYCGVEPLGSRAMGSNASAGNHNHGRLAGGSNTSIGGGAHNHWRLAMEGSCVRFAGPCVVVEKLGSWALGVDADILGGVKSPA